MGTVPKSARDLSRLDVLLQRFLLVLVFLNAPLDDVANRDQPNDAVAFAMPWAISSA
jgi:hypothetical protein